MSKKIRFVSKRKKLNIMGILGLVWIIMFVSYLATSIFLHSYNAELAKRVQDNEIKIAQLNESINATSLSVKELSTRERVMSIVTAKGLASNPDNVVSIHP